MEQTLDQNTTFQNLGIEMGDASSQPWSIITPEEMRIFNIVAVVGLCQALVLFGVVSNIINMVIFIKLGFKDSINISLFSLAISDFISSFTLILSVVCLSPWVTESEDLPFDPIAMRYVFSGGLHIVFTRITGTITGFITLERCLCVLVPLKVKLIITRKVVITFIVSTYLFLIIGFVPILYIYRYVPVFNPQLNRTIISFEFAKEKEEIEKYHEPIYHIFIPCLIFAFVIVCTLLLIASLKRKAKWRESATGGAKTSEGSTKEQRAATMVSSIAVLFIICFLPNVLIITAMEFDPEFQIFGKRGHLWQVLFVVSYIFESINASMNIFIYYHKNTNFRSMFQQLWKREEK